MTKMNVKSMISNDYGKKRHFAGIKTKPKQSQSFDYAQDRFENGQFDVNALTTMDYGKNPAFRRYKNKANPASPVASPGQVQSQNKANF